jgi:hypothetical protein
MDKYECREYAAACRVRSGDQLKFPEIPPNKRAAGVCGGGSGGGSSSSSSSSSSTLFAVMMAVTSKDRAIESNLLCVVTTPCRVHTKQSASLSRGQLQKLNVQRRIKSSLHAQRSFFFFLFEVDYQEIPTLRV